MVEGHRYLVVVSVLEGRRFPKRPTHRLVAEARFDGELLQTDAVTHGEAPVFTQELAWQIERRPLQQQRTQRAAVKVQLYAVCVRSEAREAVGFVVLDLRAATGQQTSKWYTLLHSKYSQSRPEMKLSIYIDDDNGSGPAADSSFRATQAPARGVKADLRSCDDLDPKDLKPVLSESEGIYQIGPAESCHEAFVLSVTIAFAANLPQLIPTDIPLPATGFFFYYSLLGNDVTNEVFYDLLNPAFPAERASVQLRSSITALTQFFANQPGLQVHLCCGDQSLGSAEVPLQSLLKKGSTEIFMKPVSVEGAFLLSPPNRTKDQLLGVPDDLRPLVGLAVVLRKEGQAMVTTPVKDTSPVKVTTPVKDTGQMKRVAERPLSPRSPPKPAGTVSPLQKTPPAKRRGQKAASSPVRSGSSPLPREDSSYSETFESSRSDASTNEKIAARKALSAAAAKSHRAEVGDPEPKGSAVQQAPPVEAAVAGTAAPPTGPEVMVVAQQTHDDAAATSSSTQRHLVVPTQTHHFCCSIDLRSVRNAEAGQSPNIFLRYSYAFFGSVAPIMTQPPVEVRRGSRVALPQSFCAFDFATTSPQLSGTFRSVPLIVDVCDRDPQRSMTSLIGTARLDLSKILAAPSVKVVHSTSGKGGWRQVYTAQLAICGGKTGEARPLGELEAVVSLEDWGPISTQLIVAAGDSTSQGGSLSETSQPLPGGTLPPPSAPAPPPDVRETPEYRAALELELWKEQQEAAFQQQMKLREMQHMKSLSEEWKRRDKERELLVKKRVSEYSTLEEKLRKTLNDLEKRDRQLAANETEVLRLKSDLQREHERKLTEMREASRHLKDNSEHQIKLEKGHCSELSDQVTRLKRQVSEAESRTSAAEAEFQAFRSEQSSKPEVRLQAEINMLTLEKVELERRVTAAAQSKVHYKQQWGRALRELARMRQRQQAAARAHLHTQAHELQHMRMRHLAAEQKDTERSEHGELEAIRAELEQLRELGSVHTSAGGGGGGGGGAAGDEWRPPAADSDAHVARLIEERDTLLRTGVYSADDRIVAQLDRQIREAIAAR